MTRVDIPHLLVDEHAPALAETASATFSACRTYRYALTRVWNDEWPMAAFVMLNPSTADAFDEDPTIRRCVGFAKSWNAGGLLVLNAFALRSTDPRRLAEHPDPVGPDNDAVIAWHYSISGPPIGPTIVAWGAHGTLNARHVRVVELLKARQVQPMALGLTMSGQPRHPLYLRRDATAFAYSMPEAGDEG